MTTFPVRSIRVSDGVWAALTKRAATLDMKPSVLAAVMIERGLEEAPKAVQTPAQAKPTRDPSLPRDSSPLVNRLDKGAYLRGGRTR